MQFLRAIYPLDQDSDYHPYPGDTYVQVYSQKMEVMKNRATDMVVYSTIPKPKKWKKIQSSSPPWATCAQVEIGKQSVCRSHSFGLLICFCHLHCAHRASSYEYPESHSFRHLESPEIATLHCLIEVDNAV